MVKIDSQEQTRKEGTSIQQFARTRKMSETPRKRIKLDETAKKQNWQNDDDEFFSEEMLSQMDATANEYFAKDKANNNNSATATAPSQSQSLLREMGEHHQPVQLGANVEEKQEEIKKLTDEKNLALAEIKVLRQRNCALKKESDDEKNTRQDLIECYERRLKELGDQHSKKIGILEDKLSFKQQELTSLRQKYDQLSLKSRKLSQKIVETVSCDSNTRVDEMNLDLCADEMKTSQLIPHLTCPGDGVFTFLHDESPFSCEQLEKLLNLEAIPSSIEPMEIGMSTWTENSCENSSTQSNLIHAFITNWNPDNANNQDSLEILLGLLEEKLSIFVESLQTSLRVKLAFTSPSAENLFCSSNSSTSSIATMTQAQFDVIEREQLLVLNFLWKIIKAQPKILDKLNIQSRKVMDTTSETPITDLTYQPNGDLGNSTNGGEKLCENLVKIIRLQRTCNEKFVQKRSEEIEILVWRILSATVAAVKIPLLTINNLLLQKNNGVFSHPEIGVGFDIVNESLDFLVACVQHFESLNWLCNRSATLCYISCISSLCESVPTSSYSDNIKLQLLDKIINLMTIIMNHPEGLAVLVRAPDTCNCSCKILTQLIMALCIEADKCETNIDERRIRVLSSGIQFLYWFSSVDPQFQARRQTMERHYILFIRQMTSIYFNAGRTIAAVERRILFNLRDSNPILVDFNDDRL